MNEKTIAGYCVKCNDQGFMEDLNEWNEDIAKELAKKLKIKHYSIGDLIRQIAKVKNVSLMVLSKLAEKETSITID